MVDLLKTLSLQIGRGLLTANAPSTKHRDFFMNRLVEMLLSIGREFPEGRRVGIYRIIKGTDHDFVLVESIYDSDLRVRN